MELDGGDNEVERERGAVKNGEMDAKTFLEGRILPAMIACFALTFIIIVSCSDILFFWKAVIAAIFLLGAGWTAYRAIVPRRIVRIGEGKLLYFNPVSKQTTEVELNKIRHARIGGRYCFNVGAEGGIGFQKELIIETDDKTWVFPLPLMSENANKVIEAIYRFRDIKTIL